ncbi:MAG: 2-hydroxyacyl-CoA dehydratase, partial [Clostridia bacterium]|nr:2-hydroxyacyl-CoA dehydratase [Clostridia bacterium]
VASAATGYGEEIVKSAFHLDYGIVETVAHFMGAKRLEPEVDFIIDIGGQDIKCFQIKNGAVDNIFLNEACSSGCGSFLQTFAAALGYTTEEFSRLALFAPKPVDLGSRCTVFMNSSVKQAQKDGASIENIAAGLSISVVKNALYKVIRKAEGEPLGQHIVVQGGTFLNDSVLRAFEKEVGGEVLRPAASGKMGAFGAALYAMARAAEEGKEQSAIIDAKALEAFRHDVKAITCKGCTNRCKLTVNTFADGKRYIGGNQCEKPTEKRVVKETYSTYDEKWELLSAYRSVEGARETVGIPMVLGVFELLPFWHTLFKTLGFGIRLSPPSGKKLYLLGQNSIPSDTACYPAKLVHGHIEALVADGVKTIFYPCLTYNINESLGDNHYNCPVVAYYPRVVANNMALKDVRLIYDDFGIHRPKDFTKKFAAMLGREFGKFRFSEVKAAVDAAYTEDYRYMEQLRSRGDALLQVAREKNLPVIVLSGRPYHLDREINHGIDTFIRDRGLVVISEDALGHHYEKTQLSVLNQWTYHARLYAAAQFVADTEDLDISFVQLVSFGCGVDAVTTDEARRIIEKAGKIYTQIKIDEITNLGAVKIRLRSLFATMKQKEALE